MIQTFSLWDRVKYNGKEYIVTRKRTGVDMYEIAVPLERSSDGFPTCVQDVQDGKRAEELELIERYIDRDETQPAPYVAPDGSV
jgi:hypothetical protein